MMSFLAVEEVFAECGVGGRHLWNADAARFNNRVSRGCQIYCTTSYPLGCPETPAHHSRLRNLCTAGLLCPIDSPTVPDAGNEATGSSPTAVC